MINARNQPKLSSSDSYTIKNIINSSDDINVNISYLLLALVVKADSKIRYRLRILYRVQRYKTNIQLYSVIPATSTPQKCG